MLVPVVGVLASWVAFGELIDLTELLAGAAVVAGVLVASYRRRIRKTTDDPANVLAPTTLTTPAA